MVDDGTESVKCERHERTWNLDTSDVERILKKAAQRLGHIIVNSIEIDSEINACCHYVQTEIKYEHVTLMSKTWNTEN